MLEVVCEWGKAEALSPGLPASMLCGPKPGLLATGQPLAAGLACDASVIMANCQVWICRGLQTWELLVCALHFAAALMGV